MARTLVQSPREDWWLLYHAYENGFRTLGRQALLDPFEWTADGGRWHVAKTRANRCRSQCRRPLLRRMDRPYGRIRENRLGTHLVFHRSSGSYLDLRS